MPKSLSTEEIKSFWEKRNPTILTNWQILNEYHQGYQCDDPFLIYPTTEVFLTKIHHPLDDVFSNREQIPLPKEWLKEKNDCFLVVRSTGAEDSKKSANAGGNTRIAYVPASNQQAVSSAIAAVTQSYFGKNFLQNRINAGINPIKEDLSLGVVLQGLIGEPIGGASEIGESSIKEIINVYSLFACKMERSIFGIN